MNPKDITPELLERIAHSANFQQWFKMKMWTMFQGKLEHCPLEKELGRLAMEILDYLEPERRKLKSK